MAAPTKKLIIIADDHPCIREALERIVKELHGGTTVYTATNSAELWPLAEKRLSEASELLLADVSFPAEAAAASESNAGNVPLVVVSTEQHGITANWFVALEGDTPEQTGSAGIEVALSQHEAVLELIRTLNDTANNGQKALPEPIKEVPAAEELMRLGLTLRQAEVLQLMAEGLTNKEIARRLAVSEWTVRHHVSSILERLEVSNRGRAASFAHQFTGGMR
ncbi:MAG: response regulator transcription factor [Candidimonas sp.]|nr:response regulator transcription factor [Candidimonas sp.]